MIVKIDDIEFHLLVDEKKLKSDKIPVIFLHGFTGQSEDWQFIFDSLLSEYIPIAIDLIGHGKTSSPVNTRYYTTGAITRQLYRIINELGYKDVVLVGYSMGGRAAISYCVTYSQNILGAVFESSTAGIQNFDQRKERVEFDLLLSERIKIEGVEKFFDYWLSIPLFESLKDAANLDKLKNQRIENSVIGLSNILAGFSTGLMPDFWNRLKDFNFPVFLISGELDEKYTKLNSQMAQLIPGSKHEVIKKCGHNTHLENPELFTKLVNNFLTSVLAKR
jgi:2-succinyl-6-hydroxy-2,4-cyclohexadiene-1-carboxylate synthase